MPVELSKNTHNNLYPYRESLNTHFEARQNTVICTVIETRERQSSFCNLPRKNPHSCPLKILNSHPTLRLKKNLNSEIHQLSLNIGGLILHINAPGSDAYCDAGNQQEVICLLHWRLKMNTLQYLPLLICQYNANNNELE